MLLEDEARPSREAVMEALQMVHDRLAIRLDTDEVPERASSIIVGAAVKVLRLRGYEGSTSESAGDGGPISNSFVKDVLAEYEADIAQLYKSLHRPGVRFL